MFDIIIETLSVFAQHQPFNNPFIPKGQIKCLKNVNFKVSLASTASFRGLNGHSW